MMNDTLEQLPNQINIDILNTAIKFDNENINI